VQRASLRAASRRISTIALRVGLVAAMRAAQLSNSSTGEISLRPIISRRVTAGWSQSSVMADHS
jgi:hypothetical protein